MLVSPSRQSSLGLGEELSESAIAFDHIGEVMISATNDTYG